MTELDAGASYGYADYGGQSAGVSHTSFVIWVIILAVAAIAILGGLSVAGFSFLFHR